MIRRIMILAAVLCLLAFPLFGQSYEEAFTTAATSSSVTFKPHDGPFTISIYYNATGVGTTKIQRRDETTDDWRDVLEVTSDYECNAEHYGGPQWYYRGLFSTAISGGVTVEMHQR